MRRELVAIVVLAFATPVLAEPYEGLSLGMSEPQARAILGAAVTTDPFDGGVALVVQRSDGKVLAVDICTRRGGVVTAITEGLGPTLSAFTRETAAEIALRGPATWQVVNPDASSGVRASMVASRKTGDAKLSIAMTETGAQPRSFRMLQSPC